MVEPQAYRPFQDRAHLVEWQANNCPGCYRHDNPDPCSLLQKFGGRPAKVDRETAFLIGYADLDGEECANRIWPCFSFEQADMEKPEFPFGEFDNGLHWKGSEAIQPWDQDGEWDC